MALVVLGCGWIARRHAAAARRLRLPLIFASRDVARARAYAREFGGVGAYGGYAEALGDPRARAALVCTPHDRHLDDVLQALAAGRHVLVEKPLARTLDEADRMIDAAARAGRVLMTAENFRFMPAFRWVRCALDARLLGEPRELHLIARGWRRHAGWRLTSDAGGGALIDGGIHYVHALRWWGGEVRRVFALRPPQTLGDMAGEDAVDVLAECDGGAIGVLANSLAAPGVSRFQWSSVTGTRATCFVDNRGRWVLIRGRDGVRARLFWRDTRGHEAMLGAFGEAMTSGRVREMDGAEGRRDLAVVLAAYRSLAAGARQSHAGRARTRQSHADHVRTGHAHCTLGLLPRALPAASSCRRGGDRERGACHRRAGRAPAGRCARVGRAVVDPGTRAAGARRPRGGARRVGHRDRNGSRCGASEVSASARGARARGRPGPDGRCRRSGRARLRRPGQQPARRARVARARACGGARRCGAARVDGDGGDAAVAGLRAARPGAVATSRIPCRARDLARGARASGRAARARRDVPRALFGNLQRRDRPAHRAGDPLDTGGARERGAERA